MKKMLFFGILTLLFIGCKTNPVTTLDNKTEAAVKGNWTMTSVTYPGSDYLKVTSFEMADSKCFVGSTWSLVSNNNTGQITVNNSNCVSFGSPITWFINTEGNFVMKILNQTKAKKVSEGYVLKVANVTENSFQLIDKINVGGQLNELTYQFKRNQ